MQSNKSMRDEAQIMLNKMVLQLTLMQRALKAYMFFVTLADIQGDGIRRLGGWPQFDWDGDWEVKTKEYDGY